MLSSVRKAAESPAAATFCKTSENPNPRSPPSVEGSPSTPNNTSSWSGSAPDVFFPVASPFLGSVDILHPLVERTHHRAKIHCLERFRDRPRNKNPELQVDRIVRFALPGLIRENPAPVVFLEDVTLGEFPA